MDKLIITSPGPVSAVLDDLGISIDDIKIIEIRIEAVSRPTSVIFGVPLFRATPNGVPVQMLTIPNDAIASVPIIVKDAVGNPHAPDTDPTHVSATVADPTIATAAITTDGAWVEITPLVTSGNSSVTYRDSDDNITATLDFTISVPAAVSADLNESGVVLRANPNPPVDTPPVTQPTP